MQTGYYKWTRSSIERLLSFSVQNRLYKKAVLCVCVANSQKLQKHKVDIFFIGIALDEYLKFNRN